MQGVTLYDHNSLSKELRLQLASLDYFLYEFSQYERINFEPHRTKAYAICLLSKGELKVETDLFYNHIVAPAIFIIGPSVIRHFLPTTGEFEAQTIFFDKNFFLENQANIAYLEQYEFLYSKDKHVIGLNNIQHQKLSTYFLLFKQTAQESFAKTPAIARSLIYIILDEIATVLEVQEAQDVQSHIPRTRNQQLLFEFKKQLVSDFIRHRNVSYYAQKLFVSPKYFTTVVKEESGKTAGEWIDEMVLLEAKILLQNKELTIAQVADQLNFNDQSTFGKFFKNLTSHSPLDYRKQLSRSN
ncbi:AraC-type DNA-binding protein [Chitinophaga sp. CF118]|uniref:helix-turn-helix domain-containing protein n=1 Tax=Chitinophaga sp. CF118 TaxID=1884367 RepID=UPI0008E03216|nr:helix-turn-helix domain-containing protein [Chitinophaga sp. CF118]SFE60935.1 AraC-type DNA-binding protein [Chitinophaga sp. CF118]